MRRLTFKVGFARGAHGSDLPPEENYSSAKNKNLDQPGRDTKQQQHRGTSSKPHKPANAPLPVKTAPATTATSNVKPPGAPEQATNGNRVQTTLNMFLACTKTKQEKHVGTTAGATEAGVPQAGVDGRRRRRPRWPHTDYGPHASFAGKLQPQPQRHPRASGHGRSDRASGATGQRH